MWEYTFWKLNRSSFCFATDCSSTKDGWKGQLFLTELKVQFLTAVSSKKKKSSIPVQWHCIFWVVVVELFSVFLCQGPSDSVSVGTSHKMKHPQIKRIYFYSYDFCVKDKDNQRRKKLKIKCQESLLQKNQSWVLEDGKWIWWRTGISRTWDAWQ